MTTCNQYHFSPSSRAITYAVTIHAILLFLFLFTMFHQSERSQVEHSGMGRDREPTIVIQPSPPAGSPSQSGNGPAPASTHTGTTIAPQPPRQQAQPAVPPQRHAAPPQLPPETTPQADEQPPATPTTMHLDQPPRDPALEPDHSFTPPDQLSADQPSAEQPMVDQPSADRLPERDSPFIQPPSQPRTNYPSTNNALRARQAIRKARDSIHAPPRQLSPQTNNSYRYPTYIAPDTDNQTEPGTAGPGHRVARRGVKNGTGNDTLTQEELTHALNTDFVQRAINDYKSFVMHALCYELNKQNIHALPQDTQLIITTHITVECNGTISNVRVEQNGHNTFSRQVIQGIYAASPVREIPKVVSTTPITFIFTIHPNNSMGTQSARQPGPIKFFIVDPWQTSKRT